MYAELVINIEAALSGTFHYHVPPDLESRLAIGHLVEVDFGRRLAQGIVVGFDQQAPVAETKPVIALIDARPVVTSWQIELARWMSDYYLAPLNGCLRLMLPPGLSRWADTTYEVNPYWDGKGRLTENQQEVITLLREKGDMRGRQIERAFRGKKVKWQEAANQLARRDILLKGSVLDPPAVKPKKIRTAELITSPKRFLQAVPELGRASKKADLLFYLLTSSDPLPEVDAVLEATGASVKDLRRLEKEGTVIVSPEESIAVRMASDVPLRPEWRQLLDRLPAAVSVIREDPVFGELLNEGLVTTFDQQSTLSFAVPRAAAIRKLFELKIADRYLDIMQLLAEEAMPVNVSDIYQKTGANLNHLRRLDKLELIRLGSEEVWRDPLAEHDFVPVTAPRLISDQQVVWERIRKIMLGKTSAKMDKALIAEALTEELETDEGLPSARPILLHGVTGSGKTEIYMRAVDLALSRGQTAIVLVPEIALTPQTIRRFSARFPGQVAVLHSRLSDGERYDTWRRARQGNFDIVVGPRSALFSPLENLGVIVLDEEHDHSYKQTPPIPPPYYHARNVAIKLGELVDAAVILGSATPDLVTYHQARAGKYELLELPRRIMGHRERIGSQAARMGIGSRYAQLETDLEDALTIPLPPIEIVDLRQELRAGNRSIFSRKLRSAIDEALGRREQIILFLNRRGTNTFVMCRDCGLVLICPRCEMPLTYHRPGMMLVCHHCGRKEPPHTSCPRCGSDRVKYFGTGTEEVERKVREVWPQARTIRWDRDTTAGKDSHESLLASFINHEADILVGTQMIAKGLDLPLVTLVGVISADVSLGLPDYRTGERAFQILAQVAGRAGRGLLGGKVIVQTYQPDHYAIQAAAEHDYTSFYLEEIRYRTRLKYPPFRKLARLLYTDPVERRAQEAAQKMARVLQHEIQEKGLKATELIGPAPPFFHRLDNRFRWQILVRSPNPRRLLEELTFPGGWIVDIDPESTL